MRRARHAQQNWRSLLTVLLALAVIAGVLFPGLAGTGQAEADVAGHVVISEIYPDASDENNSEFVELYNPTGQPVDIGGYKHGRTTSSGAEYVDGTIPAGTFIAAHGYYLIGDAGSLADGGGNWASSDLVKSLTITNSNGAYWLKDSSGNFVDKIAWGTSGYGEGTAYGQNPPQGRSLERKANDGGEPAGSGANQGNGWDTDDNASDFVESTPNPQNSGSPAEPAGGGGEETTPAISAWSPTGTVADATPEITAAFTWGGGAGPGSVSLELDGSVVATTYSGSGPCSTSYIPAADLSDGEHTARFTVYNDQSSQTSKDWTFTIGAADTTPPAPLTKVPAPEAAAVALDAEVSLTFDENIELGSQTGGISIVEAGGQSAGEVTYSASGAKLAVSHDTFAPVTSYTVTVPAGAVMDTAGNESAQAVSWSFTTGSGGQTPGVTPVNQMDAVGADGRPTRLNEDNITIEGIALAGKGVLDANRTTYVQDDTGGVALYASALPDLAQGDRVRVTGKVAFYNGLTELSPGSSPDYLTVVSHDNPLPAARDTALSELTSFAAAEPLEGTLVQVEAKVGSIPAAPAGGGYNVIITDAGGGNEITLRVMETTGISPQSALQPGKIYNITGIVGQYDSSSPYTSGYQIFPRVASDIAEKQAAPDESPVVHNAHPANMAFTYDRTPEISASFEKGGADINPLSVTIFLDNRDVTVNAAVYFDAGAQKGSVTYTPAADLAFGEHKVTVSVTDAASKTREYAWYFNVDDGLGGTPHFYYGVPHSHTSFSDGQGTPADAYQHAYEQGLDFLVVTDHSNWLEGDQYQEQTKEFLAQPGSEWTRTNEMAASFNQQHPDFLALRGFEMTFSDLGHINVHNTDNYVEAKQTMTTLAGFYDWLEDQPNAVAEFNHPNWPSDSFNNLAYVPEADPILNLIEVGNGAPPYSYTRTEDYYYKALDNGWHVGAVNAQDNHAMNWGDSDNLTVVLADQLNKDELNEAFRERRVYSTETRTLELTVKANGFWMGSVLDPADLVDGALNFAINVKDDAQPIDKLELVTNGGYVVAGQPGNGQTSVDWNPSVTPGSGSHWYVVKVYHESGKLGFSSPIFVAGGENDVKLVELKINPEPTLPGYVTKLTATVSNMGVRPVNNLEVKFYHDSVGEGHLIGSGTIAHLAAGNKQDVETTWQPAAAGQTRIYAVLTAIPEVTTVTELSQAVKVVSSNNKKVLIDQGHSNSEVPGTHNNLMELLRRYGYEASFNTQPLTADLLNGVDALILNTPTDYSNNLTAAEMDAVAACVNNGGSLMLATKSNYGFEGTAGNSYQDGCTMLNPLLQKLGSGIRLNNDNVYEANSSTDYSGGMKWSVYARTIPAAPSGLNANLEAIRFFSGASLVDENLQDLTSNPASGLEILAAGNQTSYNFNVQPGYYTYNSAVGGENDPGQTAGPDGDKIPIIAKEDIGSGRLVVAGRYFYSDYEIVNDVSNTAFTLRLIDWLARNDRLRSIADVRQNAQPGDIVTVQGVVTAPTDNFFDVVYIQDVTGGISLYGTQGKELPVGTVVVATGGVQYFEGELELAYENAEMEVLYVGPGTPVQPTALSTHDVMLPQYTGALVRIGGTITEVNEPASYFVIDDGSGTARIHVDGYLGVDMSHLEAGDQYTVTGIASVGAAGARVRVRFPVDVAAGYNTPSKKIAAFSDPHYYAPELGTTGQAFEDYLAQDRKLIAESSAIVRETVDSLKTSDAGIILVTGDLTKDGELLNHQQFAALLKELEDSGKKVFVVAGNHDINNPHAFSYAGTQTTPVDHVTAEQFKQIYHDFGYGEAIAQDPASLSYVVEPANGLRIIAMDSALYDTNLADGRPKTEGAFSEDRLNWIKEQISDAVSQGKTVLGMMHHGLADHFTVQRQFFPGYVINDADRIAEELAGAGMKAVFTGHFHAQDIVKKQTVNGVVYDIETGSLVTYPCPYRIVELTDDNGLNISTSRVESIDYDLGGESFPDYARDYLVEGLNGLVPQVVAGILIKQGVPADQALPLAEAKLSTPVPGDLTVKDLLVNALAGHYQGDETIAPQLLPVIQAMTGSDDSLTRMFGQALLSLGTDPEPADNDVTIALDEGGPWNLTVMHTNDTHAHLDDDKTLIAKRAAAAGQIRAEAPNSLLLDAGDVFSGTLYFTRYEGQADLEFMNTLGYDAMGLGNHEFDKGPQGLAKFLTGDYAEGYKTPPSFPVVNSNFDFSAEPALSSLAKTTVGEETATALGGAIYPAVILDVNGEKVGLIGLTTEDTDEISSPGEQIAINDAFTSAAAAVDMLEDRDINKIIAISHLGWDRDLELAQEVEGIDVVVGGHSHTTPAEYPTLVTDNQYQTPTLVVQAGEYGKYLGRLDVSFNNDGLVTGGSGELLDVEPYAVDQAVYDRLTSYRAPLEELKNTVVGSALVALDGERGNVRAKETNLGNLVADGLLEKGAQAGAVMAITNGGGIRSSINQGEITLGEVLTVMPFGNTMVVLELTGQQIVDALENGVSQVESLAGRFPQVAGLKFAWDPQKPVGSRIIKVEVKTDNGYQPIDRSANYLVATINFMATGGDGYTSFAAAGRVYDMGFVDYEVFKEYLQNHSPVNPQVEGRITEGSGGGSASGADLSSLLLSEGTLTPAFSPDVTRYEAVVGNSVASLSVTPAAADSGAAVRINGNPVVSAAPFAVNLAEGPNEITISVTAGDNTTKEYVVSITRRHVLPDSGRITLDNNQKDIEIPSAAQAAEITIPEGVEGAAIHVPTSDNQGQKEAILPQLDVKASVQIGAAAAEIEVAVPAGTKVTGPSGWDGTIRMPEILPNDSAQVNNGDISAVIEIGLPDTELAFDRAVRLLITGQAGKAAGFSRGGVLTPITRTLSADTQSAADTELTGAVREGKVNAGSDLAIWTRHFTMFVAYEPETSGSSGGGGGGAPSAGQTVTSSGGTVTGQGAAVAIPAGAVEQNIRVKVEKVTGTAGTPLPAGAALVSDILNITKDKTDDFKKPVTITMPFDKTKADPQKQDLGIYWFNDSDKQWTILADNKVDFNAGKVSGDTLHFTKFAVLAVASENQEPEPSVFKDIAGHWAEGFIKQMAEAGVVKGYSDGTFKPDNTVTRAEFAVMLVKAFKLSPQDGKIFADTAAHWAKDDIAAAAAQDIVSGYNDASFGPDDLITREQMAAMVVRAAKLTATADAASFTDSGDISGWAKASVAAAVEEGLMAGYPDNTFKPGDNATRAEAATVIRNALQ